MDKKWMVCIIIAIILGLSMGIGLAIYSSNNNGETEGIDIESDKKLAEEDTISNLKNNDEVVVEGPYGDFEPLKAKGHNVLYFAQGVGIAPFAGTLIRLAKQNKLDFKLHVMLLSHEGRDDSSCKYLQDTLAQLEQKGVNVNYYNIKQDGYFDEAKAKVLLDNGFDSIYYCGSSQLGKLLAKVYKQQGGNLNNFHQEFCNWR